MGSIKKAFDLTGKNALVTGGSRGLGLQIAEALGEQGARVVISSRKAPDLEKAQAHLAGLGIKADWIAADNSRDEDVKRLADETIKKLGRVDILVNNAGATWGAPTEDHPIEAWDKVMNLNVRSLFLLSQQMAKHSMIPNRYGRIINLASIAGLFGSSGDMQTVAYNTSKGAVVNFTRALAGSWGRYGITANALAPGFYHLRHTGVLANGLPRTCKFASFPRTAFRLLPRDAPRLLFMDPSLKKRCIAWPPGDCGQKHLNHIVRLRSGYGLG